MNAQFKKGVLELIVLETVKNKDMYGTTYRLSNDEYGVYESCTR